MVLTEMIKHYWNKFYSASHIKYELLKCEDYLRSNLLGIIDKWTKERQTFKIILSA